MFFLLTVLPAQSETYEVGQKVLIKWGGAWWPGEIVEIGDGTWKIHYDEHDSSWDEWVRPERLQPVEQLSTRTETPEVLKKEDKQEEDKQEEEANLVQLKLSEVGLHLMMPAGWEKGGLSGETVLASYTARVALHPSLSVTLEDHHAKSLREVMHYLLNLLPEYTLYSAQEESISGMQCLVTDISWHSLLGSLRAVKLFTKVKDKVLVITFVDKEENLSEEDRAIYLSCLRSLSVWTEQMNKLQGTWAIDMAMTLQGVQLKNEDALDRLEKMYGSGRLSFRENQLRFKVMDTDVSGRWSIKEDRGTKWTLSCASGELTLEWIEDDTIRLLMEENAKGPQGPIFVRLSDEPKE